VSRARQTAPIHRPQRRDDSQDPWCCPAFELVRVEANGSVRKLHARSPPPFPSRSPAHLRALRRRPRAPAAAARRRRRAFAPCWFVFRTHTRLVLTTRKSGALFSTVLRFAITPAKPKLVMGVSRS
jgi:hypothetical protein